MSFSVVSADFAEDNTILAGVASSFASSRSAVGFELLAKRANGGDAIVYSLLHGDLQVILGDGIYLQDYLGNYTHCALNFHCTDCTNLSHKALLGDYHRPT